MTFPQPRHSYEESILPIIMRYEWYLTHVFGDDEASTSL